MRRILISATVIAFAFLLVLDAWLGCAHPLRKIPTANLDRGEIFSAVSVYDRQPSAPQLVMLGSSLVTAPVMQAEAIYLNKPVERMFHRNPQFLEHCLAHDFSYTPNVFCLAVGGEMVSDAYLVTKHILARPDKPCAIVYGIAPRDFQDNLMPGIQSSEAFHVLAGLDDLPPLLADSNIAWDSKANIIFERVSSLWRYHADLKVYLTLRMKKLMEATMPWVVFDKYGDTLVLKPRKHGQFPEEALGTPSAYPNVAVEHTGAEAARFEYIKRYNPINESMVASESSYLDRLLSLCQEKNVPVLIVNMPISQFNKTLMPVAFYRDYLSRLSTVTKKYDAQLVDLDGAPWDSDSNFVDGVHLSPEVSCRFLQDLAEATAKSQVSLSLKSHAGAIAARPHRGWF
jgi:hypothetical protein